MLYFLKQELENYGSIRTELANFGQTNGSLNFRKSWTGDEKDGRRYGEGDALISAYLRYRQYMNDLQGFTRLLRSAQGNEYCVQFWEKFEGIEDYKKWPKLLQVEDSEDSDDDDKKSYDGNAQRPSPASPFKNKPDEEDDKKQQETNDNNVDSDVVVEDGSNEDEDDDDDDKSATTPAKRLKK